MGFLTDSWPILGALLLVGGITYGALGASIRADKKRRAEETRDKDQEK